MFTGFTDTTQPFFWDLQFNNERTWFQERKNIFEENLNVPFRELGKDTYALVKNACPLSEMELHLSRIYRDARRLYGKGPYKDNLWFTIKNRANGYNGPAFFFEITPASWCYGLGFYCAKSAELEAFRKSIDANLERFRRLAEQVAEMKEFSPEGPMYKKPKGDYGEVVNAWYNRKWINLVCNRDYDDLLFSEKLPEILADSFIRLMPMYDWLNQSCREYI